MAGLVISGIALAVLFGSGRTEGDSWDKQHAVVGEADVHSVDAIPTRHQGPPPIDGWAAERVNARANAIRAAEGWPIYGLRPSGSR